MEVPNYYPLGSVVEVEGAKKKLMIIQRAVVVPQGDEQVYFDYGGCLFPVGVVGNQIMYFNHEKVTEVCFSGFNNEEEQVMQDFLHDALKNYNPKKGNPAPFGSPENPAPGAKTAAVAAAADEGE